jgi:hypothetical protein
MSFISTDDISIERRNGEYPLDVARARYREHGLIVLRELLPRGSKDELRTLLENKLRDAAGKSGVSKNPQYPKADYLLGDILSIRALEKFDYIFFNAEAQRVLRVLLENDAPLYFGDSSVQYGEAARGFHKDNVERYDGTKDDWQGDYRLIRCGFYCQDHSAHSGGLKVRVASHNIPTHRKGQMLDVATRFGDLVMWNMRLTHSGNNKRARLFSGLAMHPRFEERWPEALTIPEEHRRIGAFCSFASPGQKLDRYIASLNSREEVYKPYFQRARNIGELDALMSRYGVTFRQPNNYYGELD